MRNRFRGKRGKKQFWENLQLLFAFFVVVLAIISFFLYRNNRVVFALCFFAAAAMQFFTGTAKLVSESKEKKERRVAVFCYFLAFVLLALGVMALLSSL